MIAAADRQLYTAEHRYDSPRGAVGYTLELTYSGTMLRRTGARRQFKPQPNHTLLLTPPGVPYALRGREAGEEIWVIFDPPATVGDCLDWPRGEFGIPQLAVPRTPLGRQVLQALEDTRQHLAAPPPRRERLAANALERLLLLTAGLRTAAGAPPDPRIQAAQNLIHQQFSEPLTVAALARAVGLSPSHFAHLFQQLTGVAPMRYVEELRLEQAQLLLLRTERTIKEIAAQVGFADPFYFSSRFRRRFGRPPRAWRHRRPAGRSDAAGD